MKTLSLTTTTVNTLPISVSRKEQLPFKPRTSSRTSQTISGTILTIVQSILPRKLSWKLRLANPQPTKKRKLRTSKTYLTAWKLQLLRQSRNSDNQVVEEAQHQDPRAEKKVCFLLPPKLS